MTDKSYMMWNPDTETITRETVNFGTSGPEKKMELLELKTEIEGIEGEKEKVMFVLRNMDDKELEWFIGMNGRSWCYDQLKREIIKKRILDERKAEKERQEKQLQKKIEEIVADQMRQEKRAISLKKEHQNKKRSFAESATKKDIINGDVRKIGEKIKGILNIYIRSIKKDI